MSVYRCYSAKKTEYDVECAALTRQLREQLGTAGLEGAPAISWMHWAAESARWSNCPGRASTASRVQGPLFWGNSSS